MRKPIIRPQEELYFKGETEKYIFTLLELDGMIRMKALGITILHYSNATIASQWRSFIHEIISRSPHPMYLNAVSKLDDLYYEMIK